MKSKIFICGEDGCDIVFFDRADIERANIQLRQWIEHERRERGDFPPMVEQEIYWAEAMKRIRKRRKFRVHSPID